MDPGKKIKVRAVIATLFMLIWALSPASAAPVVAVQDGYCRGVRFISENEGTITDGAVDTGMGVYHSNTDCKWVIKPTINEEKDENKRRVVLHFEYLSVEAGFDFVWVYERNAGGKLLGLFTGNTLPPTVVSATDSIFVHFKTDKSGERLGFKARWDTLGCPSACGNRGSCVWDYCYCDEGYFGGDCSSSFCVGTKTYTAIVGNMMDHYRMLNEDDKLIWGSNALPVDFHYKNNAECYWLLSPLKTFAPYFTLEFDLMDTEIGTDILKVYDGNSQRSPILAQISGLNISMPLLTSAGSELFLKFESDKLKANWGFFIRWDTMKECGGDSGFCMDGYVQYDLTGALIGVRPKQGYCYDTVYIPRNHIEKGRCICHYGWFGGDCSFKYCLGATKLLFRTGVLTDHHDEYQVVDRYNRPVSTKPYRSSSYCRWEIQPDQTLAPFNFIVVKFDYFDIESGSDFLKIYDGAGFDGSLVLQNYNHTRNIDGALTGDGTKRVPFERTSGGERMSHNDAAIIISSSKSLFLHFASDNSDLQEYRGFRIRYEGVFCYGRKTETGSYLNEKWDGTKGSFTDGSYNAKNIDVEYYPKTYCLWQIKPDPKYFKDHRSVIDIMVKDYSLKVPQGQGGGLADRLSIYDGPTVNHPLLKEFRGYGVGQTRRLTSTSQEVTVKFMTDCSRFEECLNCDQWCVLDGCCNECASCNYGQSPSMVQGNIGLKMYPDGRLDRAQWIAQYGNDAEFNKKTREPEFFQENCQCDTGDAMGWSLDWELRPVAELCSNSQPVTLKHWDGTGVDQEIAYPGNGVYNYQNDADCTWFFDIEPNSTEAGGHKVEQLNITLTHLDTHSGDPVHREQDIVTIYKGHGITDELCFADCTVAHEYNYWQACTPALDAFDWLINPGPPHASCMLTKQHGYRRACDRSSDVHSFNQEDGQIQNCYPSPNKWTISGGKARLDFSSSLAYVLGGFKVIWRAAITDRKSSLVSGDGIDPQKVTAGVLANITFRAIFISSERTKVFRNTGGANVTLEFRYLPQSPNFVPINEVVYQNAIDTNDGFYHMSYVPKFAGRHQLHIRLFGEDVTGSPYEPLVEAGAIEPAQCVASDYPTEEGSEDDKGGLTGSRAGRESTFLVKCKDMFGNELFRDPPPTYATTKPLMVKMEALELFWGDPEPEPNGEFKVYYTINTAGVYKTQIELKVAPTAGSTTTNYIAIQGSPYITTITAVPCPLIDEPEPCNGQGTCLDTGVCKCNAGWDGEYCQLDLALWLRLGIVVENAFIACLVVMFFFNLFWTRCVRDKQMFERLRHDDAEGDW